MSPELKIKLSLFIRILILGVAFVSIVKLMVQLKSGALESNSLTQILLAPPQLPQPEGEDLKKDIQKSLSSDESQ